MLYPVDYISGLTKGQSAVWFTSQIPKKVPKKTLRIEIKLNNISVLRSWLSGYLFFSLFECLLVVPTPCCIAPDQKQSEMYGGLLIILWVPQKKVFNVPFEHSSKLNWDKPVMEFLSVHRLWSGMSYFFDICCVDVWNWSRKSVTSAKESSIHYYCSG